MDHILDIFRTISTEMPEEMLYRENDDGMELRMPDSILEVDDSWEMISTRIAEAA